MHMQDRERLQCRKVSSSREDHGQENDLKTATAEEPGTKSDTPALKFKRIYSIGGSVQLACEITLVHLQ